VASINWGLIREQIIDTAVVAVNAQLRIGLERAEKDVPVRKVFTGGRQAVRFKTAAEIERDKDTRARLGLAPEILATPEAIAAVRRRGLNPIKGHRFTAGGEEFGFARTIEHPASNRPGSRKVPKFFDITTGQQLREATPSRRERGLTRNSANRANLAGTGLDLPSSRVLSDRPGKLAHPEAEFGLSARGKYELARERAISQRIQAVSADINARTGKIERINYARTGRSYLGGGLRSTLRIVEAHASQFPVIKGSLVAGDKEHDYAKYQELGTRHNPAHPFLRPRLLEWRGDLPDQLRRLFRRLGR
jgi:hypothetical protein